jgi:hypothetical protein
MLAQNGLPYRSGFSLTVRLQVSRHSCLDICVARSQLAMHRSIGDRGRAFSPLVIFCCEGWACAEADSHFPEPHREPATRRESTAGVFASAGQEMRGTMFIAERISGITAWRQSAETLDVRLGYPLSTLVLRTSADIGHSVQFQCSEALAQRWGFQILEFGVCTDGSDPKTPETMPPNLSAKGNTSMQRGAALAAGGATTLHWRGSVREKRRADFGAPWRIKAPLVMLVGFVQPLQSLHVVWRPRAVRDGLGCVQRVSKSQGYEPRWSAS